MLNLNRLKKTKGRFSLINTQEAKVVDVINNSLIWGARNFLKEQGFIWVEVPTLTKITGACENVDTLYKQDHFGEKAYLAQTGQLYLEAKIPLHKKVWTIITSSRAEELADDRHLNQFQLIELERQGDLEALLKNTEGIIKSMLKEALKDNSETLQELERYDELQRWLAEPFPRITYTKAVGLLKEREINWGDDLTSKEEKYLISVYGNKPLFITHFPKKIKFFNMRQNDDDEEVVNSADLIMPYAGESVGAAERENNHERLVKRLQESQMFKILSSQGKTVDDFKDYLDLIKEKPILHSGCGIGFNRVSQSVLGVNDIRISTNFPLQRGVLY